MLPPPLPSPPPYTPAQRFARRALTFLNTPWVDQGRTPHVALDCVGVPICAARFEGLVEPTFDVRGYVRTATATSIADGIRGAGAREISRDELAVGDVIVVRYRDGDPQHVGVVYEHPFGGHGLVHADLRLGRVVASRLAFTAYTRFASAWRLPACEEATAWRS